MQTISFKHRESSNLGFLWRLGRFISDAILFSLTNRCRQNVFGMFKKIHRHILKDFSGFHWYEFVLILCSVYWLQLLLFLDPFKAKRTPLLWISTSGQGGMHIGLWLKSSFWAFNIFFRHKPKKVNKKGIYQQTLVDSWGKQFCIFTAVFIMPL